MTQKTFRQRIEEDPLFQSRKIIMNIPLRPDAEAREREINEAHNNTRSEELAVQWSNIAAAYILNKNGLRAADYMHNPRPGMGIHYGNDDEKLLRGFYDTHGITPDSLKPSIEEEIAAIREIAQTAINLAADKGRAFLKEPTTNRAR